MSISSVQRLGPKYPKNLLSSRTLARSPTVAGRPCSHLQPRRRNFFDASGTRSQSIGIDADEAGTRRRLDGSPIVSSLTWMGVGRNRSAQEETRIAFGETTQMAASARGPKGLDFAQSDSKA